MLCACLHILVLALTPHLAFERSGLPAQYESDFFKFKHAAFYGVIKSKAGLSFAKAAVMRVIMHIDKSTAIVVG